METKMRDGRAIQLTKQIGEYLVASELARRGYLSSTFSGNVPEFDIIAANQKGKMILIQVKAINGGSWQFAIDRFVNIKIVGNKQQIENKIEQPIKNLICVLVIIGKDYGEDEFFILKWSKLQEILINNHDVFLKKHNGERPKSKESMHCGLNKEDILRYKDKWNYIK